MNVSDSEIVRAVMAGAGYHFVDDLESSDIVFLNTCAIRDNAEQRVWGRLGSLTGLNRKHQKDRVIGVLG